MPPKNREDDEPEERECLLGIGSTSTAEQHVTDTEEDAEEDQVETERAPLLAPSSELVIPSASKAAPGAEDTESASSDASSSSDSASDSEKGCKASADPAYAALCRICLEEDTVANLETPCSCSGTQQHAHHACIQRWVEEKGEAHCEICNQPYRGAYEVPPPPPEPLPVFSPMYIVDGDGHAVVGGRHTRIELLDDSDQYARNPGVSWCMTLIIFIMFLVVLHQTAVLTDGMDDGMDGTGGMMQRRPPPPPPPHHRPNPDEDPYGDNATLFLLWVGTKALFIVIPVWMVLKVAARNARRQQYEAMLRATAYDSALNRHMVFRLRAAARGDTAMHPVGLNAV